MLNPLPTQQIDLPVAGGRSQEGVALEVHKVEGDLGNLANGAVAHEVRI